LENGTKIAHVEKAPTGNAGWRAQWLWPEFARSPALACAMTAAHANHALAWGRGQ